MANTNLRQSENILTLEGILSEKALEVTTDKNNEIVIKGNLVVQTSDTNFVTVGVYAKEFTKAGTLNKSFAGMKTVLETYQSIADVGLEEATRVSINKGTLEPNTYYTSAGIQGYNVRYKTSFINRVNGDVNPFVKFTVEMFIEAIVDEVDKDGSETGRVLVKGYTVNYDGIEPITLVAPQEDGIADAIRDNFAIGQTALFYGEPVNSKITTTIEIPVAIGKPQTKTETTYKNELVISGASLPYEEGVSANAPYDAEVIKAALVEREAKLAEMEAKAKGGNSGAPVRGATPSTGAKAAPSTGRKLPW